VARLANHTTFTTDAAIVALPLGRRLAALLAGKVLPASFFLLAALARVYELPRFVASASTTGSWLERAGFYAACINKVAAIVFLSLTVICFVIRLNPVHSTRQPMHIIIALLGSFTMTLVALAEPTPTTPVLAIIAALIMVSGSTFAIIALRFLGRSFSITPEARRLVTSGLYAYVRHPMYLGELLGSLGMLLLALSPITIAIFSAFVVFQIKRMDYEEHILQLAFPDYQIYKRHTARLIPGLY
jgi:protein-S-isoprenylcysteine O-methyltransferase Ste14